MRTQNFTKWFPAFTRTSVELKPWYWLTRLKSNRMVDPDRTGNRQLYLLNIPPEGKIVHLRAYGMVKVFVRVSDDMEDVQFWATSDLTMTEATRTQIAAYALAIEEYHRRLKQCCAVERCQARTERAQRSHILCAIRAFVRLEYCRVETGCS